MVKVTCEDVNKFALYFLTMNKSVIILILAFIFTATVFAENNNDIKNHTTVVGKVVDSNQNELVGVKVSTGDNIVTYTDLDGNFSIVIPKQGGEINLEYVSFETKKVKISEQNTSQEGFKIKLYSN